jgi:hypothetical protein
LQQTQKDNTKELVENEAGKSLTAEKSPLVKSCARIWVVSLMRCRLRRYIQQKSSNKTSVKRMGVTKMKAWYSFSCGGGVGQFVDPQTPIFPGFEDILLLTIQLPVLPWLFLLSPKPNFPLLLRTKPCL